MILRRRWFWRVLLVVYLAAVAYVCFAGQGSLPDFGDWKFPIPADKCVHFLLFLPWPILACLSVLPSVVPVGPSAASGSSSVMPGSSSVMPGSDRASNVRTVVVLLIITIIGCGLAGATEYVQGLLPYRSRDILDFIADCLGLLTGALLFAAFYPFLRKSGTR